MRQLRNACLLRKMARGTPYISLQNSPKNCARSAICSPAAENSGSEIREKKEITARKDNIDAQIDHQNERGANDAIMLHWEQIECDLVKTITELDWIYYTRRCAIIIWKKTQNIFIYIYVLSHFFYLYFMCEKIVTTIQDFHRNNHKTWSHE